MHSSGARIKMDSQKRFLQLDASIAEILSKAYKRLISFPSLRLFCAATVFSMSAFSSASYAQTSISFVGNVSYTTSGSFATLQANQVSNTRFSGYSGTLRMELWAFSSPYYGGGGFGYKLATYQLGQLTAGYVFNSINSGSVFYTPPPNGTWYYSMLLTEYDGSALNGGYSTVDHVNFTTPVTIGFQLLSQTIFFANPGNQALASSSVFLSASTSSGLPVTFSSDSPSVCTVSGSYAYFVSVGTCTIRASQYGNGTYAFATPILQSFLISIPVSTGSIKFVGSVYYSYAGAFATLRADQVSNNRASGYSGTLRMELWAFSLPYNGSATVGYKLATYQLGQLSAGFVFNSIDSGLVPYTSPSIGTWYYSMLLTEYDGSTLNGGYSQLHHVDFSTPVIISASLINQTISFANPGNQLLGTGPIFLSASSTSGLSVTFSSDSPSICTVSGSYAYLVSLGICTIRASQVGNSTYASATQVVHSFVVSNFVGNPLPLSKRGGIDLDGSGKSAIIVRSLSGQLRAGRMVNNNFQWSNLSDPGTNFSLQGTVDFAGNGKSDLTMLNLTQGDRGDAVVWRDFMSSSSTILRKVRTLWRVDAVGDLDGDGFGDLVWRFTGNSGNIDDTGVSYIWFTDGTGVTQVRKRGGAPLNWTLLGAADINADGAADMVYISPNNVVRVLMATPNRTCANISGGNLPAGFTPLHLADFSGQKRGDILARKNSTGQVQIISLNATGLVLPLFAGSPDDQNASCTGTALQATQSVYYPGTVDPSWTFYATGDFNGDGIFDVVWQRPDGTLTLWLMNAGGASPTVIANAGTAPAGFTVFQEGGGGGTGVNAPASSKAEGTYTGTTSNGYTFTSLVLENDQLWSVYGLLDNQGTFQISGLVEGDGLSNNGTFFAGNAKDFFYTGAVTPGQLSATYVPGVSLNGSINGTTFYGTTPRNSTYVYGTPAQVSDISGFWSGAFLGGNAGSINISQNGGLTGSSAGCAFGGTIAPRPSGKNVYNVSLTFGGFPCLVPGQSATGIGVWYYLPGNRKQLLIAGTDISRSAGSVFVANH